MEYYDIVDAGIYLEAIEKDKDIAEVLTLDRKEAAKIRELLKKEFINQNEEPGKSAYPILKAIMEFGSDG